MNKTFISLILFLIITNSFSQIIKVNDSGDVESSYTPEQLVEDVLISGACAIVDNFDTQVYGNANDLNTKSYGYFKINGSDFPFEEGIVISSGKAYDAGNTVITAPLSNDNGLLDDTDSVDGDLNDIFPGETFTNATIIEFDFTPYTNEIKFRFLLASEEYLNTPCDYSDGFAFLLKDVLANTITNIAVVPGTSDVASTNNIHSDILDENGTIVCSAQNEDFFEGYNLSDTNFNGRTKPMIAYATVVAGKKYRLKMVVADAGANSEFDSAIFLEAGSFDLGFVADAEDIPKLGACDDDSVGDTFDGYNLFDLEANKAIILNGQSDTDFTLTYFEDDAYTMQIPTSDINTYQNLADLQTIYVQMTNNSDSSCMDRTFFEIEVYKLPEINYLVDLLQCDDDTDGISILNLNTVKAHVSNNYENETFTFYKNKPDAEAGVGASLITTPDNYENTSSPFNETVFVRVENAHCYVVGQVAITVSVTNTTFIGKQIALCDDEIDGISTDQDGISEFDLTQFTSDILDGIPAANQSDLRIKFYHSFQDAQLQQNVIIEPTKYRNVNTDTFPDNPERIFIRVENINNLSCAGLSEDDLFIDLIVKTVPFFEVKDKEDLLYCTNWLGEKQSVRVEGYLTNYDYVWKDADGNVLETDAVDDELAYFTHAGEYTVTAINPSTDPLESSDCEKTISFTVKKSSLPIIKRITIDDNLANNTITVIVTGDGDYQFALDNDDFKDPNITDGYLFNHVIEGTHLIRIKDLNGCNPIVEKEVIVIRFPKHISPEDQNRQFDTFSVYGGEGYVLSSLYIYDKYGKVIAHLQNNEPWDGTYLGKVALESDYWFNAIFVDAEGKTYKRNGHFSLIRP